MVSLEVRVRQLRRVVALVAVFWTLLPLRSAALGRPRTALAQAFGGAAAYVVLLLVHRARSERAFARTVHTFFAAVSITSMLVAQQDALHRTLPVVPSLVVPAAVAYLVGARSALVWGPVSLVVAFGSQAVARRALWPTEFTSGAWEAGVAYLAVFIALLMSAVGARGASDRRMEELARAEQRLRGQAEELAAARDAALAASRFKSSFLVTMSHELRTPLNGMLGMTAVLLEQPLRPDQRAMLTTVLDSGQALLGILNEVLDLAKIEAGRLELTRRPFALRPMVEAAAQLFSAACRNKSLSLRTAVEPDVPEWVSGDEARVRQILNNLVGNAVKFTEQGAIDVTVSRGPDDTLILAVADTGIGIPEDKRALIFDAFAQADSTIAQRYGGSGLGLAIVRRLSHAMGGGVELESAVPGGSTFRVRLPLPAAEPAPSQRARSAPPIEPTTPAMRVLVVEDNRINQDVARAMLTSLGHEVTLTDSGEAALERAVDDAFDLVITDMRMPGMDGIELAERLRRAMPRPLQPYLAAMTASAFAEQRSAIERAEMDFVAKPVARGELVELLARARRSAERLDGETLDALAEVYGPNGLDTLLDDVLAQVRDALERMDATEDLATLKATAHSLVGSAGTGGAFGIARAARSLERADDLEQARARLRALRGWYEGTLDHRAPPSAALTGLPTSTTP
jgi:signal transduction histidine kinase/DNA-binding response OmpR family regulator